MTWKDILKINSDYMRYLALKIGILHMDTKKRLDTIFNVKGKQLGRQQIHYHKDAYLLELHLDHLSKGEPGILNMLENPENIGRSVSWAEFLEMYKIDSEDDSPSPITTYGAGHFTWENSTIEIHVKEENPQVEALINDVHNTLFDWVGKEISEVEYEPMTTALNQQGEEVNIEDLPKDEWRESMKDKE